MSTTSRLAIVAALIFLCVWIVDTLIDHFWFSDESFVRQLLRPSAYELYMRLVTGTAISLGVSTFLIHRQRSRKVEQDLIRQKNIFQDLVESSPGCLVVHREQKLVYGNRNALEFFGWNEPGSYLGASILDFIAAEGHQQVEQAIEEISDNGRPREFQLKVRLFNGQVRDVETSSTRISWFEQPAILTFFRDITEEMTIRRDLLTSRERLQLALDAARDGVWDWNITTGEVIYNEAWATMLGYTLPEVSSSLETWRSLIHPQDYMRVQALLDSHLQGKVASYEIEVRLRHKRGHYVWVLDRGRVVERDEAGNPLRMTGTHRDITPRKEAELALEIRNRIAEVFLTAEDTDIFNQILNVVCESLDTPVGIFTTLDSLGRLHVVATQPQRGNMNDAMESALTFDRQRLPEVFDRVINQCRFFLCNEPLDLRGHLIDIRSVLGVPVTSRDQVLGGIYVGNKTGGFHDADRIFLESLAGYIAPILQSHLKSEAREIQLRQAQKMEALGALAGGIAHDFNNILQAIMGFTTLALEDAGQSGNIPGDLERVLKATRRGQDLVKRILLFSRREEQKYVAMNVQQVVGEAINLLKPSIPATIEIKEQLQAEDAVVFGDPGQISQIVLNLATNSYHAMDPVGGLLEIDLTTLPATDIDAPRPDSLAGQDLVVLRVADTGAGMSPQVLARLYDPFFTTKQVGQGTGLGMSVVHGIVKAHQGEILIHSELEIGTVITVFLPRWAGSEDLSETEAPFAQPVMTTGGRHIVLVDDENDITDLGKALLERSGHRVSTANNGRDLLSRLESDPGFCDLVITDLTMPQITGLQLADRLKQIRPGLPVLLITGMTDQKAIDIGGHPNIRGLIRKPFGGDALRQAVERALEEAESLEGF